MRLHLFNSWFNTCFMTFAKNCFTGASAPFSWISSCIAVCMTPGAQFNIFTLAGSCMCIRNSEVFCTYFLFCQHSMEHISCCLCWAIFTPGFILCDWNYFSPHCVKFYLQPRKTHSQWKWKQFHLIFSWEIGKSTKYMKSPEEIICHRKKELRTFMSIVFCSNLISVKSFTAFVSPILPELFNRSACEYLLTSTCRS